MSEPKLINKRGEEPTLIPGHSAEAWQNIDYGLGVAPTPVDLGPKSSEKAQPRSNTRILLITALAVLAIIAITIILKASKS